MTKTPLSSPGILIHEFKSNAMFDEFINQILGDERVVVGSVSLSVSEASLP